MITDAMISALPYVVYGILLHLIVDWVFNNDWISKNKHKFGTAMIMHGAFHLWAMLFIFPAFYAMLIVVIHVVIDTRIPLRLWRWLYSQTTEGEMGVHVGIWEDQVFHWVVICVVALWLGSH